MKSNYVNTQQNLRGKKSIHLSCGCCDTQDFREDYRAQQDSKMIRDFRANPTKDFLTESENQARIDEFYGELAFDTEL